MKHLDQLLDELQEPIAQIMDWCKEDQDRAIVACWKDIREVDRLNALDSAYPGATDSWLIGRSEEIGEEILLSETEGVKPVIDYESLYLPLEPIINDRIEFYNAS